MLIREKKTPSGVNAVQTVKYAGKLFYPSGCLRETPSSADQGFNSVSSASSVVKSCIHALYYFRVFSCVSWLTCICILCVKPGC